MEKDKLLALADKVERAANAQEELTQEDLDLINVKSEGEDWEEFCAKTYLALTGQEHPGSTALGRGRRSRDFGSVLANAIRSLVRE